MFVELYNWLIWFNNVEDSDKTAFDEAPYENRVEKAVCVLTETKLASNL